MSGDGLCSRLYIFGSRDHRRIAGPVRLSLAVRSRDNNVRGTESEDMWATRHVRIATAFFLTLEMRCVGPYIQTLFDHN